MPDNLTSMNGMWVRHGRIRGQIKIGMIQFVDVPLWV